MKIASVTILTVLFMGGVFMGGDSSGKTPEIKNNYKPLTNKEIIEKDDLFKRADALEIKIDSFSKEVKQLKNAQANYIK